MFRPEDFAGLTTPALLLRLRPIGLALRGATPPFQGGEFYPISAAAYERHLARHDGHELHIGFKRKVGHIEDGLAYVFQVETRFGHHRAVRLNDSGSHTFGHLGSGVTDVDLAAGDIVFTA